MTPGSPADIPLLLLVEDNDGDALLVEEALGEAPPGFSSYRVFHVGDLRDALDAIRTEAPACVLLDLGLPDASGVDGVDRLVREFPGLPVIVLTGVADPEMARTAIHHGAQDFVTKSTDLSPEVLARAIANAIERAETNQALIDSNKALVRFASMVAHDLRSPLTIASGMLELLDRKVQDQLDPELLDLIDRSVVALRRASDMISALLMYSRATRPDEGLEEVDLSEVAEWAAAAAGVREAQATITIDEGLPTVLAGEAGLRQVFQNLLSNSVRYADSERPLEISIGVDAHDDHWDIHVTDNGIGIPPDKRQIVFREGERLERAGDGMGLGLSAVEAVVSRLGGEVWIEDPPGGQPGTRVTFTLPRGP